MKIAIHQPHYFPWLGYFHKMASVDLFVLLDEVQFEKQSQMNRNRVVDQNGEIKYLTIPVDTSGFLDKKYCEIPCNNNLDWAKKQINSLENYYKESKYRKEIINDMVLFLSQKFNYACEWTCSSINYIREVLGIITPIVFQSQINYDKSVKKSNLVLSICKELKADVYYSGRGSSVNYLDRDEFRMNNIGIEFQNFTVPTYIQLNTKDFVPGLSILDMLFNCGKEKTRELFWETIKNKK